MTNLEKLNLLNVAYRAFDAMQPSMSRTFMTKGREILEDELFSARGVYAKHKINFYDFIDNHFGNAESDKNAILLYGEDRVTKFLDALDEVAKENTTLSDKITELLNDNTDASPEVKQQVTEALEELRHEDNKTQVEALKEIADNATNASPEVTAAAEVIEKTSAPAPKKTAPGYGLNLDIDKVFNDAAKDFLTSDKEGILKHVSDSIKAAALQNTLVVLPGQTIDSPKRNIIAGRLHMEFKEVLEVTLIEKQTFLGGPAGTGKTTLGAQVAEAMGLRFAHISCTAGMSEAHLLGRMVANGDYIGSNFVDLYENGGVFLADEIDAADANTLLILNSALANGYISVPNRADNPTAKRHKDFYLIAAANTFGNGSSEYSGREILDAAFMDRFAGSKIEVLYDTELEREICKEYPALASKIWKIRNNVKEQRIKRVVSTRVFAAAVRNMNSGRSEAQFFTRFFTDWTIEEVKKATA